MYVIYFFLNPKGIHVMFKHKHENKIKIQLIEYFSEVIIFCSPFGNLETE
jgi:hypothetical protein